jgi:hypothetical protein
MRTQRGRFVLSLLYPVLELPVLARWVLGFELTSRPQIAPQCGRSRDRTRGLQG